MLVSSAQLPLQLLFPASPAQAWELRNQGSPGCCGHGEVSIPGLKVKPTWGVYHPQPARAVGIPRESLILGVSGGCRAQKCHENAPVALPGVPSEWRAR